MNAAQPQEGDQVHQELHENPGRCGEAEQKCSELKMMILYAETKKSAVVLTNRHVEVCLGEVQGCKELPWLQRLHMKVLEM